MKRIMMFIDSNNFHNDCKFCLGEDSTPKFNWYNLILGIRDLYRQQEPESNFYKAFYYSALADREDNPAMHDKHKKFLDAINRINFVEVKIGHLMRVPVTPDRPIVKSDPSTFKHVEKCTDVNISNDILENSIRNNCDVVILVSADGDYEDTIVNITSNYSKEFFLVLPIGTPADRLKKLAGSNILYLNKAFLQKYIIS